MESGDKIMEAMEGASSLSTTSAGNLPQASEVQKNCFNQLLRSYDSEMGGFSKAPKFPQPVNFNFLFHYYSLKPKDDRAKQGLKMALHTLDMMAKGGIHDHVSQVSSNFISPSNNNCCYCNSDASDHYWKANDKKSVTNASCCINDSQSCNAFVNYFRKKCKKRGIIHPFWFFRQTKWCARSSVSK